MCKPDKGWFHSNLPVTSYACSINKLFKKPYMIHECCMHISLILYGRTNKVRNYRKNVYISNNFDRSID